MCHPGFGKTQDGKACHALDVSNTTAGTFLQYLNKRTLPPPEILENPNSIEKYSPWST